MKNRLFIALEIPEEALDKIIEIRDKIYDDASLRWEAREKLHITLKFLGDVEEEKNQDIIKLVEEVFKGKSKFDLRFEKFGLFKKNGKPKILWIKTNDSDYLKKIYEEIEDSCYQLGFSKERRGFKSHLTLLRIKGGEDIQKIYKFTKEELPEINFTVSTVTLFKSELKPEGSVYHKIKNFYLH